MRTNLLLFSAIVFAAGMLCGCGVSRSNSEIAYEATEIGSPQGEKISKEIGATGGSITSVDGRLTLTVPPNAVAAATSFSIQPITNKAGGGMGSAYRLEPTTTFQTPVRLTFDLRSFDLAEMRLDSLLIAFQDPSGKWQPLEAPEIDRSNKTLTVPTTHFTDFSIWSFKLIPEQAAVHLSETVELKLIGCIENRNWLSRLKTRFGVQTCTDIMPDDTSWSVDVGTITPAGPGMAVYQAPAGRPRKTLATVRFVYKLRSSPEANVRDVRMSLIRIIMPAYTASGQDGPVSYSGTICDPERPFTVIGTHPIFGRMPLEFNPLTQTMKYGASGSGISAVGGATYSVDGLDSDKPNILFSLRSTARSAAGTTSGGGQGTIKLTPTTGGECN